MTKIFPKIGLSLVALFLLITLFFLKSNKFDTSEEIKFILLFGILTLPIVLSFLFKAKSKISIAEISLLTIFLVLNWASFVFSETKNFGFTEVFVLTGCISIYLALRLTETFSLKFADWLFLISFFAAFFGLFYFCTQFEPRIAGPFLDPFKRAHFFPNAFALFLLMTWPLGAISISKRQHIIKELMLGVILAALALTFSRGAWVAFFIQIIVLAVFYAKNISFKTIGKIILVLTASATIVLGTMSAHSREFPQVKFSKRIQISETERQTSLQERADFYKGAAFLAFNKPFLGYGPFSFGYVYRGIQKKLLAISDHPHNWFLKIAAENGILSFLLLIAFFALIFNRFLKNIKKLNGREKSYTLFLAISISGGIIHNLIDYNLNFMSNMLILWILLAFSQNLLLQHGEARETKFFKLIPIIFSLFIFALAVHEGYLTYQIRTDDIKGRAVYETTYAPRNYFLKYSRELFEKKKYDKALQKANEHIASNKYDAEAYNLAGEIAAKQNNLATAKSYFEKAIENDPKNFFSYYKNYLNTLKKLNENKTIEALKPKIITLLEKYNPLFKANAHFTVFTENPFDAAALYDFFGAKETAEKLRKDTESMREKITKQQKFTWENPFR